MSLLENMGLVLTEDGKLMPSPKYLAEIVELVNGTTGSDGKPLKITRKVGQDLLRRKFDTVEFISGILSGKEEKDLEDVMKRIESHARIK